MAYARIFDKGDYYAILPMLPELQSSFTEIINVLKKELCSSDFVIDLKQTKSLLRKNKLMIKDIKDIDSLEILR